MDPLLGYVAAASLCILLLASAIEKIRYFSVFEGAVVAYRLVPDWFARFVASGFVVVELLAAVLLLWPTFRVMGGWLAVGLLLVATAAMTINLLRGHTDVSCGCGSLKEKSAGLSWWLVVRNLLLLVALSAVVWPVNATERVLGWVDGLTFFGATLAFLGMYYALDHLIESHSKLQKLKEI
ncbi:MauE/DoxX family redox-associated membrane protein [Paenalcaligenes sp. Me131]|uniref:MauE/DoxX family redox-associated membrane protein n=1 Tax=Paenalcaligenes sp. Me131 TaxID=3392636 RepID=UPI003D2BCE1A